MGFITGILWSMTLFMILLNHVQSFNYFHYDDCQKPSNDGNIYITKNSTWLECKNGVLERYCIAEKIDGHVDCVPHFHVKAKLDEMSKSSLTSELVKSFYGKHTDNQYASCSKIQEENLNLLQDDEHKMDCLQGRQKENTMTAKNIFCTMTSNNVYYVDSFDWYKCKNGEFHLERCVKKIDDKHHCLSTQKINQALEASGNLAEFNKRRSTFCYQFFKHPTTYMPNYIDEMKMCSDYNEALTASEPERMTEAPYVPEPLDETEAPYVPEVVTEAPLPTPTIRPTFKRRIRRTRRPIRPPTHAPEPVTEPSTTTRHPLHRVYPGAYHTKRVRTWPNFRRHRTTPAPSPSPPVECKIKWGYQNGKCFDPKEAAEKMMSRPMLEAFNRPDKLLSWGSLTIGQAFEMLNGGRRDSSGMSLVETVGKATGLHKCDVITSKLPLNDEIYNSVAKTCTCSETLPCY